MDIQILRNAIELIKNIPDYTGGGVYALIDQNGKVYIGSSQNINKRIKFHHSHMKTCLIDGRDGFLNNEIEHAILNGAIFTCEILCKFNVDMTKREREEIERVFLKKYGGIENTYNLTRLHHKI